MTTHDRDKVISAAKECGMIVELQSGAASCVWTPGMTAVSADDLIKFASIISAYENQSCADIVIEQNYGDLTTITSRIYKAIRARGDTK